MRPNNNNLVVLFPPLEDAEEIDVAIGDSSVLVSDEDDNESSSSDLHQRPPSRGLQPSRRQPLDPNDPSPSALPLNESSDRQRRLASNFELLKKRKRDEVDVSPRHVHLALETAQLVGLEIARMQRAVAELESLLDEEDDALQAGVLP